MKRKITTCVFFLLMQAALMTRAQFAHTQITNLPNIKDANTSLLSGDTLYVAGAQKLGAYMDSYGSKINLITGAPSFIFAMPNGIVQAAIADGNGGWFIGGRFTQVGGAPRAGLAQIDATGNLTSWNPGIGNGSNDVTVGALALSADGNTLYVGGDFTELSSAAISRLGAISTSTGVVDATFDFVTSTDVVNALVINGNTLYAGTSGSFQTTDSTPIPYSGLIAVDLDAKTVAHSYGTSLNTSGIYSLALRNNTLYVGGHFTSFMGEIRNGLASISLCNDNNSLNSWNPNLNGDTYTLALTENALYAGGNFTSVFENSDYKYLTAFDLNDNGSLLTSFNPLLDAPISKLATYNGILYALAYVGLTTVEGTARSNASFAIDLATNILTNWEVKSTGYTGNESPFQAIAFSNNALYIGGAFTELSNIPGSGLLALKLSNGEILDSFAPGVLNSEASYNVLTLSGNTLYAGGTDISSVGGTSHGNLTAFNRNDGSLLAFNPIVSAKMNALLIKGSTLYIGGDFTKVNNITRNRLAALDIVTGALTSWNPNMSATVNTLALYENGATSMLYAGGTFTTVGGISRNKLAAFDLASSGALASWDPNANGTVYGITAIDNVVYVGGNLTSFGGVTRNRIAAFDPVSGALLSWNPNANQFVSFFAANSTHLFIGGRFTNIDSQTANYLAAFVRSAESSNTPEDWTTGLSTYTSPVVYHSLTANDKYLSTIISNSPVIYALNDNTTLPVMLTGFTAKTEDNRVKLEWQTTQEHNNHNFVIYRKGETGAFTVIGARDGAGTTLVPQKYVLYDKAPLTNTNYYKLVQVDNNGKIKELGIKSLAFNLSELSLQIAPNPVTNGKLQASFAIARTNASLTIIGIDGKVLLTQLITTGNAHATVDISKLAKGVYILKYSNDKGYEVKRFIVP